MSKPLFLTRAWLLSILVAASFTPAWSQTATTVAPDTGFLVYTVRPGDTLNNVWSRFMRPDADRAEFLRLNQISNQHRIAVGLELRIPRPFVVTRPSQATVIALTCHRPILIGAQPLSVGGAIQEGDVIHVPADCHVAMAIEDGSVIQLPSSASLTVSALRKNALEAEPEVRLELSRGRVEINVKKNRSRNTPFEVVTPKAVMGVRGTEFRVGYSPDKDTAQVEVLSGTVAAQGQQDAASQNVEKGYGLPIDAQGVAQELEALLPPPRYASSQRIMPPAPGRWIRLQAITEADAYIANSANTANMGGTRFAQTTTEPQFPISRLDETALFLEFLGISPSGLQGLPARYGFCQPISVSERCNVVFDVPMADGVGMSIDLDRVQQQNTTSVIKNHTIQAKQGRFSVQNLPAGHYQWTLRYALGQNPVVQSGQFELIAIGRDQP